MSETKVVEGTAVDESRMPKHPIVLNLKKQKKSGKRYSKGLEELQRSENIITRSTHRMTRAIEKGIATYRKKSRKSASKKKDGTLRDFVPNATLAMSQTLKEASSLPYDLARILNTKKNKRRLKRQIRAISRAMK